MSGNPIDDGLEGFPATLSVTCEQCDRPFTATVLYEPTDEGGELVCFDCPHCDRRYEAATVTAHGIRLREQLQRALDTWRRHRRPGDRKYVERLRRDLAREVRRAEW